MTMPMVDVDGGVRLFHQDFGEGPPVVFVHGGSSTHAIWEHQVAALSDRFRTIAYDHRGVGRSDVPRDGFTVDRLADDLAALVDRLALDTRALTLVTHGLGGHVALRCLVRHPGVTGRLVLAGAAPWFAGDREGAGGFSDSLAADLAARLATDHAGANWDLIGEWMYRQAPELSRRIAHLQMAMQWPLVVVRGLMRDLRSVDHRPYLPDLAQPTLVVHGRHDRKNRFEGSEYLADHLPGGRLLVLEESGHCPFLEQVEAFNEEVAAFAGSPGGPRTGLSRP